MGSRKIQVHLVDVESMEIVGAWLATATAIPPVVTKTYDVDLPLGRPCHKRIAYANPWSSTRLFRLSSSDTTVLRPRYENLEVRVACIISHELLNNTLGNQFHQRRSYSTTVVIA